MFVDNKRHTTVRYIDIEAMSGASISQAIREAIVIAATEWRNVRLHHNGKVIRIEVNDLFNAARETVS